MAESPRWAEEAYARIQAAAREITPLEREEMRKRDEQARIDLRIRRKLPKVV